MKKIFIISIIILSVLFSNVTSNAAENSGYSNFKQINSYIPNQFWDVSESDWFYHYTKMVYEYGMMNGTDQSHFNPYGNITTAESIAIYSRLHHKYHSSDYMFETTYPWYQTYVDYAAKTGFTLAEGVDINSVITRADFSFLLSCAFDEKALNPINQIEEGMIPDISPLSYYYNNVYSLYRAGILSGSDAYGTFAPNSHINRSEVAAIISRMINPGLRTQFTPAAKPFYPVPIKQLANYSNLKKKLTDYKFEQAYNIAVQIVKPFASYSREEQLICIANALRQYFEDGMQYSMSSDNYNNVYGYFVDRSASCSGCTRATGLCLNILGIPYEHVNENQYTHQWCRVNVDGVYWICDAYGLYAGPEDAPYMHPYF